MGDTRFENPFALIGVEGDGAAAVRRFGAEEKRMNTFARLQVADPWG